MIEKLGITPGPWKWNGAAGVYGNGRPERHVLLFDDAGGEIEVPSDEVSPNGRLIGNAFDMLESFITIALGEEISWGDEIMINDEHVWNISVREIEKATGRSWTEVKELINE